MAELPPFETFFAAVHRGLAPFPWQTRLAATVVAGGWPEEIGVPTGLGKTACLDIAIWVLATQVGRPRRTAATRIWYVVNRRLLVDAAYQHGQILAELVHDPTRLTSHWPAAGAEHRQALEQVAAELGTLPGIGMAGGPLHTVRLRGGADLGARPSDPSQPTLLFATVPMFASRWLFRGYGTSRIMRPVDAALAGTDSLVLLDEAHLAGTLMALREPLAACDVGDPTRLLPEERCSPRFVALTATGGSSPFDLDADDLAHPVVRQRIRAAKPTRMVQSTEDALVDDLAAAAIAEMEDPRRTSCLIFCNTPARARAVAAILREAADRRVLLVTGRIRDREADVVRHDLLDPYTGIPAGRDRADGTGDALWVVATQTLEVGADIDVDVLVTETAGMRALVQRLGRCNRLGISPAPTVVVCHAPDLDQPLYGDEPALVWQRLHDAPTPLSLSPAAVGVVLGRPADLDVSGAEPLPGLLWEWVKTSLPPAGEAPVEVYFADGGDHGARVSVCWRAYRPDLAIALQPPVSAGDTVDIPIGEMRTFLQQITPGELRRLASDRASLEPFTPEQLRPGDVVVLRSTDGGYDQFGWNPDATEEVLDASLLAGRALPLSPLIVKNLVPDSVEQRTLVAQLAELDDTGVDETPDPVHDQEVTARWLDLLSQAAPHPWVKPDEWTTWCGRWQNDVHRPVGDLPYLTCRRSVRQQVTLRADAFEHLSFDATSVALDEHLGSVGDAAGIIARHLGLPGDIVAAISIAARWHDLGKSDWRFQRWLDPYGRVPGLLAKSGIDRYRIEAARIAAGWPRGGRHEAVSGQLIKKWLYTHPLAGVDQDLVLHLVLSHHGEGRPMVPVVEDPTGGAAAAIIEGTKVEAVTDLSAADWEQPSRFRRLCERYGYWGLALLEAIVRQADQAVSSAVVV